MSKFLLALVFCLSLNSYAASIDEIARTTERCSSQLVTGLWNQIYEGARLPVHAPKIIVKTKSKPAQSLEGDGLWLSFGRISDIPYTIKNFYIGNSPSLFHLRVNRQELQFPSGNFLPYFTFDKKVVSVEYGKLGQVTKLEHELSNVFLVVPSQHSKALKLVNRATGIETGITINTVAYADCLTKNLGR